MTDEEIEAVWSRYMHRADLTTDYADTWLFVNSTVNNAMMFTPVDLDAIKDTSPEVFVHGGLMYLAELAQDDVQLERETMKFRDAASGYQMNRSIQNPAQIGA